MNFIETTLAATLGQTIAFLLYQGFVNSYWGRNAREEVSRWFDRMSKHMRKMREPKIVDPSPTTSPVIFQGLDDDDDL